VHNSTAVGDQSSSSPPLPSAIPSSSSLALEVNIKTDTI